MPTARCSTRIRPSPHPREGRQLSPRVPIDANVNPRGAKQDEDRGQLAFGYVVPTEHRRLEHASRVCATAIADNVRGFLREDFADDGVTHNADGFQQDVDRTEVYFDSHFATPVTEHATLVWGLDYLYGKGDQHSQNFEYAVLPNGIERAGLALAAHRRDDARSTTSATSSASTPISNIAITDAWRLELGVRFNHTNEKTNGLETDLTGEAPVVTDSGSDERNDNRWAGAFGTSYRFWQDGHDYLTVYANYRDTFKPAVVDFGPEAEFDILKPEDAQSGEIGIKGRHLDGHFEWDLSVFRMNFHNLVVSQEVDGLPALTNAGKEKFKGAETEARWNFDEGSRASSAPTRITTRASATTCRISTACATQLDGNLLEMSPQHLGSVGLMYTPPQGFRAYAVADYVGKRWLNKRNTALAGDYTTFDAGIGYAWDRWEVRADGYNLSDRRDPVSESELGDAQYYLMPARSYWLTRALHVRRALTRRWSAASAAQSSGVAAAASRIA